jgi:membrane-anchored glycerophosphoryl diester phosphodiesterase (GDPDase)
MLTILLLLVGSLQLQALSINQPFDVFFGGIFSITVVALCFAINTMTMLALTEIAEEHRTLHHALAFAWQSFTRSPLVAVELAALQFGVQLIGSLVFITFVTTATLLGNALIPLLVNTHSMMIMVGAALLAILLTLTAAIACAGALVTFTYTVWTEFAHQERATPKKAKLARVTRRHFWV